MGTTVVVSFTAHLAVLTLVGIYAASRRKETPEDYLLAGRRMRPWTVALSAAATSNSGVMFVGLIGQTYLQGVSVVWILVGSVCGDYLMWRLGVQRALRARSAQTGSLTIASFMGHGSPGGRRVTALAGLFTLVFLGGYAATQLAAGSKALHAVFGWDYSVGAAVGAVAVVLYCFAGGIRASMWTDVAQSAIMMVAMVLLLVVAVAHVGGPMALWHALEGIDPQLVRPFPADMRLGVGLFLLGWLVGGMASVGQPHIIVRAMTIDSPDHMNAARRIYVLWFGSFAAMTVVVGLAARVVLAPTALSDAELALPLLAGELLPGVLVGLILAGLFSAVMSTADSQLIACAAALTQDIFPRLACHYWTVKAATLGITGAAFGIALLDSRVFELSFLSWSFLGAAFAPLLVLRVFAKPVGSTLGVCMMLAGASGVVLWRYVWGYSDAVYDVLPGVVASVAVYGLGRAWSFVRPQAAGHSWAQCRQSADEAMVDSSRRDLC